MVVVAILLFLCSGCVTMGHRFYSGQALPDGAVAIVHAVSDCRIQAIRNEAETEEKALGITPQYLLELLPGRYGAVIQFGRIEGRLIRVGGRVQRVLDLRAGNIYVVYPKVTEKTWSPVIVNLSDYTEEECTKSNGGSCPSADRLRESTARYLFGDRLVMSYHPADLTIDYDVEGQHRIFHGFWW